MPVIDLGRVIGPQGPQGETGAQGIRGEQGLPGPNQVTNSTATPLTGVLTGNGSVVGVETIDAAPTAGSTGFATSGGTKAALDTKANQDQLATVEIGSTASRNYAVGEYFCWNGLLYRAKTAISSGGTFTVNTNCEQVTVGDSLYRVESKMKQIPLPSNGSVTLEFGGLYVALLTIRGTQRDARTITFISGYGEGSLRNNIDSIYNGWEQIAISINGDSIGVTITSTYTYALTINLLILQGNLVAPTT